MPPVDSGTTTSSARHDYSSGAIASLERKVNRLEDKNVTARERYRTALEANQPSARLATEYHAADRALRRAEADLQALRAGRTKALAVYEPFAVKARPRLQAINDKLESDRKSAARQIFLLRALLAFGLLGLSLYALRWTLERAPRLQPLAQAAVGATAVTAIVMICDYSEVSFDFSTVGPLGLAVLGSALTVAAFFALQRYLRSRVPARRLRSGECRNCGYPARGHTFCERCGEQLLGVCDGCQQPRVLGAPHCGQCGAEHVSA
ncbi:MAG: zinc ribbon domain-containing protein [Solirubrobacterales bacterium]